MKLTIKDKEFLEKLKELMDGKELFIELKTDGASCLVLRRNYGDHIEKEFNMTRQGIRWRFNRLVNEIYVAAYETIFWVESQFGTALRKDALTIAKERIQDRRKMQNLDNSTICRRQ